MRRAVRRLFALVDDRELQGASRHALARPLRARADGNHDLRTQTETHVVADGRRGLVEHHLRRIHQLHDHFRRRRPHRLAGTHVERDAMPSPRVDVEAERGIRRHARGFGDAGLVAVAADLAAYEMLGAEGPYLPEYLCLFVPDRFRNRRRRRFHREVADDLQQMILDDVADDAGLFVEGAAALDAEAFGQRDLHVLDVMTVPDRFQEGIREAEVQDVLHGFFPEVVVDAEDVVFG